MMLFDNTRKVNGINNDIISIRNNPLKTDTNQSNRNGKLK